MPDVTPDPSSNSLGLQFDAAPAPSPKADAHPKQDPQDNAVDGDSSSPKPADGTEAKKDDAKEKKKPYVNPDRFMTGGAQREKLTAEELASRMDKIREQNEKIKQRRIAVEADEQAFVATQQRDHAKQAENRKIQESINRNREQNARRKMEKMSNREWDSGKPTADRKQTREADPKKQDAAPAAAATAAAGPAPASSADAGTPSKAPASPSGGPSKVPTTPTGAAPGRGRGGPRRGRGGRAPAATPAPPESKHEQQPAPGTAL